MFITMLTRFTWGITVRPTVTPAIASDTAFSLYILHRIISVAIDKTRILLTMLLMSVMFSDVEDENDNGVF